MANVAKIINNGVNNGNNRYTQRCRYLRVALMRLLLAAAAAAAAPPRRCNNEKANNNENNKSISKIMKK
jgi:hypothetical protein